MRIFEANVGEMRRTTTVTHSEYAVCAGAQSLANFDMFILRQLDNGSIQSNVSSVWVAISGNQGVSSVGRRSLVVIRNDYLHTDFADTRDLSSSRIYLRDSICSLQQILKQP